jgi:rhamnulokinase
MWFEPMCPRYYVACDLGAESCRVILGTLSDKQLVIEEIHRFPNGPVNVFGTLRWDVLRIFDELKHGLRKVALGGYPIESISADSWGLDYVYVRGREPTFTAPYSYRDARTDGRVERAFSVVPRELIYSETGIQFIQVNALYQLLDDLERRPEILQMADQILGVGDYFNYLFSGVCCSDESLASTWQLYNPTERKWSQQLIEKFQLPTRIFPKLVPCGTKLGSLLPSIADEVGLQGAQVVASCSHDTAAAVAAVPAESEDWAYNSSGTWSLLGIESPKPIIDEKSREHNFTNEAGYGGTIRFLKNIVGLWVVQECRRQWAKEGQEYTYDQLTKMAEEAEPLKSLIDPRDPRFGKPYDMPKKIESYCRETKQIPPKTPGETIRCALESLALLYHDTLQEICAVTSRKIKYLHIVGGGSRNQLLNQLSANACQMTVVAGPTEATAVGNILIQAIAMGQLSSLEDVRRVVRRSFPVTNYDCKEESTWRDAYERFQGLIIKH